MRRPTRGCRPGHSGLSVVNTHKEQAVRRRRLAGDTAVAGGEDFSGPRYAARAAPDFDKRADDRSHHVIEKAVAGDFKDDAIRTLVKGLAAHRMRHELRL